MKSKFLKAIDYYNPDISLEHHGVKGMRWGVRTQKPYVPVGQRQESSYDSDYEDRYNEESYSRPVSNIQNASPETVKKKSHWVRNALLITGGAAIGVASILGTAAVIKRKNSPDSILTEGGAALKDFMKKGKEKQHA